MAFNPLQEKGTPMEKQLRSWNDIVKHPYDKKEVDAYTRTRQILMNGIEIEGWIFKHNLARMIDNVDLKQHIARTRHVEDQQQTTINWLAPHNQTVLETTLGYEQVAVDLTAYLAQNEPDEYVRKTFDFGLLEDFDHLYRYSQMAGIIENSNPNEILQNKTDVFPGRPTQDHHNDNGLRIRKHYDKNTASPQTKVNILTLVSAEQQTHNFYKAHGFMYANPTLRKLFAEIGDVEEEHVSMYESLMDPTESVFEKLLLHEFTEVCNYYTCMQQEKDERIKKIWEEFLSYEIGHLHSAAELFKKHENRDAEEIIGNKVVEPNKFISQKDYVAKVLREQCDLRLTDGKDMGYTKKDELPDNWPSFRAQEIMNAGGAPSEMVVRMSSMTEGRDVIIASQDLANQEIEILEKGLDRVQAPDTVNPKELEKMISASKK